MNIFDERYLDEFTKNDFMKLTSKQYLLNKKLVVEVVENATVLPPKYYETRILNKLGMQALLIGQGGIVDKKGAYVEQSAQRAVGMRDRVVGAYEFNKNKLDRYDEKVIYLNYFIKQWGHFLLDVIGRLWYPLKYDREIKIVYTCYSGKETRLAGNYLEFFKLLGIDESRLILVNKPTQFSQVIVPESSILPGGYYTEEYREIFNKLVSNVQITQTNSFSEKIYCSRSKLSIARSKEIGETEIEKIFLANGYSPIYTETMTLTEQIQVLNSAKTIVMSSGSLAHNLLFITKDIDVFILNKTYRVNLHQFLINEISKAKIKVVDYYLAPLPILYGYGPFLMDITQPLQNFFDDNDFEYRNISVLTKAAYRKFYLKWLWSYKFFLFRLGAIREGDNEFEKSLEELRRYYKLGQKNE
ncbi:glycosyltransferase 61 family protein [Streptococcus suis]